MKYVITHYGNHDLSWVCENTDDFVIYNRTDEEIPNSIKRDNVGDADYDKLTYLIDNYYELPEVFLWSKSNIFKFITPQEFDKLKNNQEFTPLLTQNHKVYEPICRYEDGIYCEINNSWFLNTVPARYFQSYGEFARSFNLPNPDYLKFAPGGSYILTRERVQRYAVDFYKDLASLLPYCQTPGEAHMLERTYFTLWS